MTTLQNRLSDAGQLLPRNWIKPFNYLVERATKYPAIASFPGLFLAAVNGDDTALQRVLVASLLAYREASKPTASPEIRGITNAVVWLSNQLVEVLEKEDEAREAEKKAAEKKATEAREAEDAKKKAAEEKSAAADQQQKSEPTEVQ